MSFLFSRFWLESGALLASGALLHSAVVSTFQFIIYTEYGTIVLKSEELGASDWKKLDTEKNMI